MKFYYSNHAVKQMFKRNISPSDVEVVYRKGQKIKQYPDDKPFPSELVLGFVGERP